MYHDDSMLDTLISYFNLLQWNADTAERDIVEPYQKGRFTKTLKRERWRQTDRHTQRPPD